MFEQATSIFDRKRLTEAHPKLRELKSISNYNTVVDGVFEQRELDRLFGSQAQNL